MDDKTIWRCPVCEKDGCVDHDFDEPMILVLSQIVQQHNDTSPLCCVQFDKIQIRWKTP